MPARSVCLVTLSLSEAGPGRFGGQVSVTDIYHTIPYHTNGLAARICCTFSPTTFLLLFTCRQSWWFALVFFLLWSRWLADQFCLRFMFGAWGSVSVQFYHCLPPLTTPFTEGCAGADKKASPPGRHQEQSVLKALHF